jgi:hypothetical protein
MSDMIRKQVLSQLERKEERGINVMYLGDSENDNPLSQLEYVLIQD